MSHNSTPRRVSWGSVLRKGLKPILALIVVFGITQAIRLAWIDLHRTQEKAQQKIVEIEARLVGADEAKRAELNAEIESIQASLFSFKRVRWGIAASSIPISCLSLFPPGIYWWLTLRQFGRSVPFVPTMSAYTVGGLGKYVPGKAMVLILRSAAMQKEGVPISVSLVSIFIETLMALAAGGGLGTLALSSLAIPNWLRWILVGTSIVSLIPILPPLFNRLLKFISQYRHFKLPKKLAEAMTWRFVGEGWFLSLLGQALLGISLWVICESMRGISSGEPSNALIDSISSWQLLVACFAATSMGFVIGFLSMLPGGAGARELAVTLVLAPVLGYAPALAAAVLFRISALLGDLITALVCWCVHRRSLTRVGSP
jgi:glycosyltransferase 2 family protein